MENGQLDIELLNIDDDNTFGPHIKEVNNYKKYFFTTLHDNQDISKNEKFIQWKKEMKKISDFIIHCPKCHAYFPNPADAHCVCHKCDFCFCFGCNKDDCDSTNCIKWWRIIISFYGLKEYHDKNIIIKILMFFSMLLQVLFTFPLQVLYKNMPNYMGNDGYRLNDIEEYKKYRRKGCFYCFIMLPYQIAFIVFWFYLTSLLFVIPGIIYPPYTVYWMGIFWYVQTHLHGGTLFDDRNESIFDLKWYIINKY